MLGNEILKVNKMKKSLMWGFSRCSEDLRRSRKKIKLGMPKAARLWEENGIRTENGWVSMANRPLTDSIGWQELR